MGSHSRPGREWKRLDLGTRFPRTTGNGQHFQSVPARSGPLVERNERPGRWKTPFFGVFSGRRPAGLRIQRLGTTRTQPHGQSRYMSHTNIHPARSSSFLHQQEQKEECPLPLRHFCRSTGTTDLRPIQSVWNGSPKRRSSFMRKVNAPHFWKLELHLY